MHELQNSNAWCVAKRGEYSAAAAVLPDPGDDPSVIDTRARIELGLGNVDKAIAMFAELREREPTHMTFAVHLLAARLQSSSPPTREEVAAEIERFLESTYTSTTDAYTFETLTSALDARGHADLVSTLFRGVSLRTSFPDYQLREAIVKRCPECRTLFYPSPIPSTTSPPVAPPGDG